MIGGILLTLFLVFLNGFFVAAEFAIVKVRGSQIDVNLAGGGNTANVARHVTNHLDAYLSATQLGITLASLGLGWIGEGVVSELLVSFIHVLGLPFTDEAAHKLALPLSFALITFLHIVFGELAPKSLAIRYPLPVTLSLAAPLRVFYFIFFPFIWMLNGCSNFILRLIGIQPVAEQESHTEEEIRIILGESMETGHIRSSEHELIENIFRFDENTVKKVMIPRTKVAALNITDLHSSILKKVIEEGYSRMPVYENNLDKVLGVLYSKDFFRQMHNETADVRAILHAPYFVSESKKIGDLLKEFQKKKMHMAIVVDEFGGTSGIVTLEDILEEIVGEIQDESDEEASLIENAGKNEWLVDGMAGIDFLNVHLPTPLPQNKDYNTLSGLLLYHFGGPGIPKKGQEVSVSSYTLTVVDSLENQVKKIRLKVKEKKLVD